MNYLKLTTDNLNLTDISNLISHESCGGIAFFVGTTRDFFEDKQVVSLEYEAYEQMALKSMTKICDELRAKWPDIKHIAVYHRLGIVPIKEASVIIGISSPHRKSCLDAVQVAIDQLKRTVPIWKKEKYAGAGDVEGVSLTNDINASAKLKKTFRRKLPENFFANCNVQEAPIKKSLIQIHADKTELNRRVNCFVERKREDIDLNNIKDFIDNKSDETNANSCARVNSSIYRLKNSNKHFEVHRVKNEFGPQTNSNYFMTFDKFREVASDNGLRIPKEEENSDGDKIPFGLIERLSNAEQFLNIKHSSDTIRSLYKRMKAIEERLLYLETLSPEYNHFLEKSDAKNSVKCVKRTFSVVDLDFYINELETGH